MSVGEELWRSGFLELFDVAVFDLAHEIGAMEEVVLRLSRDFAGDDKKLIVDHCAPGDGTTGGNQVSSPLKNEGQIPQNEKGEEERSDGRRYSRAAKGPVDMIKQDAQTKNE